MKKLLIVDDHSMFVQGLKLLLASNPSLEVTAIASQGFKALEILETRKIDIVLMDVNIPVLTDTRPTLKSKRDIPKLR